MAWEMRNAMTANTEIEVKLKFNWSSQFNRGLYGKCGQIYLRVKFCRQCLAECWFFMARTCFYATHPPVRQALGRSANSFCRWCENQKQMKGVFLFTEEDDLPVKGNIIYLFLLHFMQEIFGCVLNCHQKLPSAPFWTCNVLNYFFCFLTAFLFHGSCML